jgi:hypothetical protein
VKKAGTMTAKQDDLDPLLARMSADGASTLILVAGRTPTVFVAGSVRPVVPAATPLDATTFEAIMQEVVGEDAWSEFIKASRANPNRSLKHRLSHGDHEFLVTAADTGSLGLRANFRLFATRRQRSGKVPSLETIGRLEVLATEIAGLQP